MLRILVSPPRLDDWDIVFGFEIPFPIVLNDGVCGPVPTDVDGVFLGPPEDLTDYVDEGSAAVGVEAPVEKRDLNVDLIDAQVLVELAEILCCELGVLAVGSDQLSNDREDLQSNLMSLFPGNLLSDVDFHLDIVNVHFLLLVFKTGGGFGGLLSLSCSYLFPHLERPQKQGSWSRFVVEYLKNSAEHV